MHILFAQRDYFGLGFGVLQSKTALSEMIKMISAEHLSNNKKLVAYILNTVKKDLCGLKFSS